MLMLIQTELVSLFSVVIAVYSLVFTQVNAGNERRNFDRRSLW